MSAPTRDLAYFVLEDCTGSSGSDDQSSDCSREFSYTERDVDSCLSKVQMLEPGTVVSVGEHVQVLSLIAGHVLGACMFFISVDNYRVLYTGDFTSGSTFHLPSAKVDIPSPPDVVISEATYATSLKDGRLIKYVDFFQNVVDCLLDGGKVLLPVFAIGRAQELLSLLEMYWERFQLSFPIFFCAKNAQQVLQIYVKYYAHWTSHGDDHSRVLSSMDNKTKEEKQVVSSWKQIQIVSREELCTVIQLSEMPLVALTTPGTLARGLSLHLFQWIATEERNLLIIPHFCMAGTMEKRMLDDGYYEKLTANGEETIPIRCKTMNLHFGFHPDTRDLLLFFSQWKPSCIVLVHGEGEKMDYLARVVQQDLNIECWVPKEEQWVTWKKT